MYVHLCIYLASDSSPEGSFLAAAAGTRTVAIRKTKSKGRYPSPKKCDKGTAKTVLGKKHSQTSPCGGKFY